MNFRLKVASIVLATLAGLGGCVSLLPDPKPAPTVYRLAVLEGDAVTANPDAKVINIEYPTAPRALNGTDIILSPDGRRLTAAAQANWAEAVPSMLRNTLIEVLTQDPDMIGMIPRGSTRVQYRLNIDIRRFEAVFENGEDAAPVAMVRLNLSLTDTSSRQLIGSHTFSKRIAASAKSVSSIVRAQDAATSAAMHETIGWLRTKLSGRAA